MTANLAVSLIVSLVAGAAAIRISPIDHPPIPEDFDKGSCSLVNGDRVERGPTWTWGNEESCNLKGICMTDGSCLGTIDRKEDFVCGDDCYWYLVNWDCGTYNYYRQGGDKCDLIKVLTM